VSISPGTLYVVATPIGNLADITDRAREVLTSVDLIAAEDTRHTAVLLQHLGISSRTQAFHEHNEREMAGGLIQRLQQGQNIALVSDAGTPLISDPGYHLVRLAHEQGIPVVPVPGASALLSALSVSGLPTHHFVFEGFLPAKPGARRQRLETLRDEVRTLVFFEAPHRIVETLEDMLTVFGGQRTAVLARELTKRHETVRQLPLEAMLKWVRDDPNQQRGESVILLEGSQLPPSSTESAMEVLQHLLQELPLKQAVRLAASITGARKNELYKLALEGKEPPEDA
jgi:16S rRNA (cytidine1402-2'-O)-methyltransferase